LRSLARCSPTNVEGISAGRFTLPSAFPTKGCEILTSNISINPHRSSSIGTAFLLKAARAWCTSRLRVRAVGSQEAIHPIWPGCAQGSRGPLMSVVPGLTLLHEMHRFSHTVDGKCKHAIAWRGWWVGSLPSWLPKPCGATDRSDATLAQHLMLHASSPRRVAHFTQPSKRDACLPSPDGGRVPRWLPASCT